MVTLDLVRGRSALLVVMGAAALLALGELASLSLELRAVELVERGVLRRALAHVLAIALGGVAVAAIVELATRGTLRGGLDAGVVAVAAAVAVVALAGVLAAGGRRDAEPPD